MDALKRFEQYKEMYLFEFERRNRIHTDVSVVFGITSFLIGVMVYLSKSLLIFKLSFIPQKIIVALFFTLFVSICFSLYYIIKTIYKYDYGYVPYANQIENYYNKLSKHYTNSDNVNKNFVDFLIKEYTNKTTLNTKSNELKILYLVLAKEWLLVSSIICIILSFLLFCIPKICN